ncbi:Kunitz trypsin inhibitor [Quillaja saponaria]|uniref:Kunitz trypsin inhibitor n=1 Tax=Quillaja saponaria TaxID=32244 RepID=A0AAD7Q5S8_QUISA|nr:Kunitz trypsin inhibitor [Quillaja saponaria]
MKKTSPLLLALSGFIILFSFIFAKPFLASAELVLDANGEPLQWFNNYYVSPHIWGPTGGGLSLGTLNNNSCPHYVIQEKSEVQRGLPIKFSPVFSRFIFVTTNTPLTIQTINETECIESLVWKLVKESTGLWLVSTNGTASPGTEGITSRFVIERIGTSFPAYKIVFCLPTIPTSCKGLGRYFSEDGERYLAWGDEIEPFPVVFFKETSLSATTSSQVIRTVA